MTKGIKFALIGFIAAITFVAVVWKPVLAMVFVFSQAPDPPRCDIGDGYEFWGWPGPIIWHTDDDIKRFIEPDGVVSFGLCEGWILGESASGKWFAIDKKNFKEYYPLDSKTEALAKANKTASEVKFYDDPKPFEVIRPWTPRNFRIAKIVLLVFPVITGLLIFVLTILGFPWSSKQN